MNEWLIHEQPGRLTNGIYVGGLALPLPIKELWCHRFQMTRYLKAWRALPSQILAMLLILGFAVTLANVQQPYPAIAPLQHVPTVLLILAAPILYSRWPLSKGAVASLLAFWLLHTLGGRYTYSNVPYDEWARSLTGHTISTTFGLARNGYDRLVHLSFGLFWVLPFSESARRHAGMGRHACLSRHSCS